LFFIASSVLFCSAAMCLLLRRELGGDRENDRREMIDICRSK
jgi:hypothetical protein